MPDISNSETTFQNNTESQDSKPQRPKKPELYFLKTYPFRYDSSHHHPQEQDYWNETVEIETSQGQTLTITAYLLRVYPTTFNEYDAYMDIPYCSLSDITGPVKSHDIKTAKSPRLEKIWKVVAGPQESTINGYFRGDYTNNNPPAWIFGLRLLSQEQSRAIAAS
jgi:hypothetical protein